MTNIFEGKLFPEKRERETERKDWGVALDVPSVCASEAYRIRDNILSQGIVLTTQLEGHPHITLFQGEFSTESDGSIQKIVTETVNDFVSRSCSDREIKMEGNLQVRKQNNNIFWNVVNEKWIADLHEALDARFRSLPEWKMMKQFRDRLERGDFSEEEQQHIQKYGVLSAGPLFLPHITIGKLADSKDSSRIETMSVKPIHFQVENMIVGYIDRYGQIDSVRFHRSL